MNKNTVLDTERLVLRKFTLDDTSFIIELLNSPGWLRYIGDRNVKTKEQALDYLLEGPLKSYEEHGFGLCSVDLKSDAVSIGTCGILKRAGLDSPDIGFAFLPEYNGQGYAFEIASATLQLAKTTWKIPVIAAITNADNKPSIKLLGKIGLSYVRNIYLGDELKELMLFNG